jgi:CHAT domain-containing protein
VLAGDSATEESFKALKGKNSPGIIHIATHGLFFPEPSKKIKNDSSGIAEYENVFSQSNNPLLRSAILFAGANNFWKGKPIEGIDDGILTAYEVSNEFLPATRLVVLSACETGLGDIQGTEGVYGLQRAFKMAGVQYLLMSLWQVPDNETAEFMQAFYQHLFDHYSIENAFHHAQTLMKNKYRQDPFKWAAWILVR